VSKQTKLSEKSLVTQKYLQGKSMNKIANETGISKGKVHYLISEWKDKMGSSDIDEIKEFVGLVKKSGMSIEQCALGFRTINILKGFGLKDENIEDGDDDGNGMTDNTNDYKEFSTFVEDLYKNCKTLSISPAIIRLWIEDLLDFNSTYISSSDPKKTPFSLSDIDGNEDDGYRKAQTASAKAGQGTKESQKNTTYLNPKSPDVFSPETKIPFVSQVSFYVAQKKKQLAGLNSQQKAIESNIQKLEEQKNRVTENLMQLSQREKPLLGYIKWFDGLEKALRENYSINIQEDIQSFSQLINDFKERGYDANEIIQEYLRSLSIKMEIKTHTADLQSLQVQKIDLTNSLEYLQSQTSQHKQTMGIYRELEGMRFGLKEIKQLWNNVLEIAEANGISHKEAVSKFLKDIEEQYDDKLGFEAKVNEKRDELALVNRELSNSRQTLWFTPLVGPSLSNLFQRGIGEQDIIGINQIASEFANNNLQLDLQSEDKNNINKDGKAVNSSSNNSNNSSDRTEYWKSFIEKLKKLGNINSSIKKQHETLEKIRKETVELNTQKQDLYSQCQTAVSFIGLMARQIHHLNGLIDYYYNAATKKVKASSPTLSPLLINLIYVNLDAQHKDDKVEDEKK
jgi:hypothetical protein